MSLKLNDLASSSANESSNLIVRFLPSVIFLAALLSYVVVADREFTASYERDSHEAADAVLSDVQSQFSGFVSRSVRSVRRLAFQIDPSFDIDQQAFEALVAETVSGPAKLLRAELSPAFVTRLVSPLDGNEAFIGTSPLASPDGLSLDLAQEAARGFPVLKRLLVNETGAGELQVRAEIRVTVGTEIISVGMVSLVKTFELMLSPKSPAAKAHDMEMLVLSQPAGSPPPEVPPEWQEDSQRPPITQTMRYPPGDFHLFLRPVDGWAAPADVKLRERLKLLGLGALLLLPTLFANWIAVSREGTRTILRRTKTELEGLLRNLPGAAMTMIIPAGKDAPGPDDKIQFLNPDISNSIWGLDADVMEKNPAYFWESAATPEDSARLIAAIGQSMQTLAPIDMVWPIDTPDGERKWLHGLSNPTRKADGSVYWSALVFDDTLSVERQAELEKQRELVFHAQKIESVGQLTGGVAHDFNNLLAVILGNLELLLDDEDDPARHKYIQAAIQATGRGADLSRSMLAFAGRARLSPEVLKLNDLLAEAQLWIERTLPATVTVEMSLKEDLWDLHADRSATEGAVLNLILNARDAMDGRGTITIATENVVLDAHAVDGATDEIPLGRYVLLSITDTGEGIPRDQLQKIFEPFFTTKETGKGSGLGLSMVKGFISQTGGTVKVESQPGVGTTFRLYFSAAEDGTGTQRSPTKATTPLPSDPCRILLAEDEDAVRQVLKQTLEQAEHIVTECTSGDDALALLRQGKSFDLLITDIVMPGDLQGVDLALAAQQFLPSLPIILISGYAAEPTHNGPTEAVDAIRLTKPVQRADLLAAVKEVTTRNSILKV